MMYMTFDYLAYMLSLPLLALIDMYILLDDGDLPLHLLVRSGSATQETVELLLRPIIHNPTICSYPGSVGVNLPLHSKRCDIFPHLPHSIHLTFLSCCLAPQLRLSIDVNTAYLRLSSPHTVKQRRLNVNLCSKLILPRVKERNRKRKQCTPLRYSKRGGHLL